MYDAIVVGGGFYGVAIATYLVSRRKFSSVVLLEKEPVLLGRASYHNQARIHNGYHYPRSYTTAYRSRINLPRFVKDFRGAVMRDRPMLYAIARKNSKITSRQFDRFCRQIGADLRPAPAYARKLCDPRFIESVFLVDEFVFNAANLRSWAVEELNRCGVDVRLGCQVVALHSDPARDAVDVHYVDAGGERCRIGSKYLFNCTYSGMNQIGSERGCTETRLKHEVTEMALMAMPPALAEMGITVMDGPFFSLVPFPDKGLHTLSHVRYTPHFKWIDSQEVNPYEQLKQYRGGSRVQRMVRDVSRYIPQISKASYVESFYEVKTVLLKNEVDDGRPILFERNTQGTNCYSVLGGKIDNIYDVLEKLDAEQLPL